MKAELISIGDEILIGQVIDTNSVWIAQRLMDVGVEICQMKSIPDKPEHIVRSLEESKADLVILTGGLGPTNDDLTKDTLVKYFQTELVFQPEIYTHIQKLLVGRGVIVNDLNKEQAMLPKDALLLHNTNGTAAGMWFSNGNKQVISLPGVPFEMKGIMLDEVLPRIMEKYKTNSIVYKTVMTQGLPESMLAMKIKDWEDNLPDSLKLAYLPRPGIVRLRLSASGSQKEKLEDLITINIDKLKKIIPNHIFGLDDITLQEVVGDLLKAKKLTISTAESCTGGNISALLTSISGSSNYFQGSIISYSNRIKSEQLAVSQQILEEEGAVSRAVVEQMALSCLKKFDTDIAISVSGIAGPEGGTEEKPVGTTWVAVASKTQIKSQLFMLGENRGRNVTRASFSALNMLRLFLLDKI